MKWLTEAVCCFDNEKQNAAQKRLRQSEVFFSLAYHTNETNRVVEPGICPVLLENRLGFRSCHRHLRLKGGGGGKVNIVCVVNSLLPSIKDSLDL